MPVMLKKPPVERKRSTIKNKGVGTGKGDREGKTNMNYK